jgi:hypothetical protein
LPERVVTLYFEDGPYEGLEVDVSLTAPMALFWRMAEFADEDREEPTAEWVRETMLVFGGQVRSWNLTGPDGAPIPATPEAFADQLDMATQGFLIARWLGATRTPPAPLSPGPRKRRTSARK